MRKVVMVLTVVVFLEFLGVKNIFAACTCKQDTSSYPYKWVVVQITGDSTNGCGSGKHGECPDPGINVGAATCKCVADSMQGPVYTDPNAITREYTFAEGDNYKYKCVNGDVDTALGCVPTNASGFTGWLMTFVFGIAGGIAFLLMVWGFILIATSGGDEKKVAGAKETITSAIIGLAFCIFSIFILRLIALDILNIPGMN